MIKRFLSSALEVIEVVVVAFGAVFLIKSFLVQPFLVSGSSMVPNFSDGDYLLVDEATYHFRPPQRGEVIVFRYPKQESVYFVKRIIGLPGERVQIKNGRVIVFNQTHPAGLMLAEPYLPGEGAAAGSAEFQASEKSYFVMGDNRLYSFDSRSWGMLPEQEIIGLVQLRLWPPTSLKVFAAPSYQN